MAYEPNEIVAVPALGPHELAWSRGRDNAALQPSGRRCVVRMSSLKYDNVPR